tara:strand:- start:59 stop:823 length:765 start_codon:yes stop_codon:yes gene_type:complete
MKNVKSRTLILLCIITIILLIGYFFSIYFYFETWGERASFGDMFGAIGTLFAGLSFAGIIYTINIQREEIKYEQFLYDNKEKEHNKQNFENKFFLLYNDLIRSIDRLEIEYNKTSFKNHMFFKGAYFTILNMPGIDWKSNQDMELHFQQVKSIYNSFLHKYQNEYSVFTSKLFFLLQFLDKEKSIDLNEKLFYSGIINTELNSYTMVLLIYHAFYKKQTKQNWFTLLKKFRILENMNEGHLLNKDLDLKIWEIE